MTTDGSSPFGEFEADFKKTEKADPFAAPGRVPEATYKFVCTSIDAKDDGVLIDKEIFVTPQGTKAFKLYCEILEPESVVNPKTKLAEKTKGQILEKVFWVTAKTLPYVKRDLTIILGRDFRPDETLGEVCQNVVWGGRTFEGVVQDNNRNPQYPRSEIAYINPWAPPPPKAAADPKKAAAKEEPKKGAGMEQKKSASEPVKGAADF
jgi:hypothetical protein